MSWAKPDLTKDQQSRHLASMPEHLRKPNSPNGKAGCTPQGPISHSPCGSITLKNSGVSSIWDIPQFNAIGVDATVILTI